MAETQFVSWKEEYSVGAPELDGQHETILNLLNDLYKILQNQENIGKIRNIMSELGRYTNTHFADEEKRLQECNYPAYEEHKQIHTHFASVTQDFVVKLSLAPSDLTHEIFVLLKDWWIKHILSMDRKYAPFLQGTAPAKKG